MSDIQKEMKQIIAASGDWFRIQVEPFLDEKERLVMSRLTSWSLVVYKLDTTKYEVVQGIDTNGFAEEDEGLHYHYVCGQDLAPNGQTWLSVFNETPSFHWGLKDISALEHPKYQVW